MMGFKQMIELEQMMDDTKQITRGYKGMNADMTCRGMQYKVGESYHIDGYIGLCERGFHFCEELYDVMQYYPRDNGNRFFEVEASGAVIKGGDKCVASDLKIVRELTEIEVSRHIYGEGFSGDYGYGFGFTHGFAKFGFGDGGGFGDGYGNGTGCGDGYGDGYDSGFGGGYCGNSIGDGRGDNSMVGDIYRILKFE